MKEHFTLTLQGAMPPVSLRAITKDDLEDMRVWKNDNRTGFFFKEEITSEMQQAWFQGYLSRPRDYMFLVESAGLRAGCMGFRIQKNAADCYNIIGARQGRGKGILGAAMRLMCSYIKAERAPRIGCLVLKNNPAVAWYQKCGYRIASQEKDYFQMDLDMERFEPAAYLESPS